MLRFFIIYFDTAATTSIPNTNTSMIIPISEITNPAIAIPFGFLNIPTKDKTNPNIHIIHPITGIQPKKIAIKDITKPAVPIPLVDFSSCLIIIV